MVSKRYPTSIEVARLAGVSQSAVSRTFTPGASVSARTREKVLAAAETLGFQPSLIPKIMLTDRSGLVALVVGGLENAFYARVVQSLAACLREAGNQIVLVPVDSDYTLDAVAARLAQYRSTRSSAPWRSSRRTPPRRSRPHGSRSSRSTPR